MTVEQLRAELALLGPAADKMPVVIWLPGSRIDLGNVIGISRVKIAPNEARGEPEFLIEGNLREGSALDT
jgi:hypothetical protein